MIVLVQGLGRNTFFRQQPEVMLKDVRVSNCSCKGQVIFSLLISKRNELNSEDSNGRLRNMGYTFFFLGYGGHLAIDRGRIFSPKHCLPEAFSTQNKTLGETVHFGAKYGK